jgi:hypothetical protein
MEPSPVFDRRYNFLSARRCSGRRLSLLGLLFMVVLTRPALSEVFLNDPSVEISGTGTRVSRNCTVLLKPTQTFGDSAAPRLMLVTTGNAQLSYGLDKPAQYANQVIVQNNVRRPFAMAENASIEQFHSSDIGKAIKSRRLFFVTAQLAGGKYVSSRYDRVDFDAILAKIETVCPFDAESLMTDKSPREQAERSLRISPSDLTLIRWALGKKYGGPAFKPDPTPSLLSQERAYLKRYASDNGLMISQFLTADTARRLTADGQLLATPTPAPTPTPTPPPAAPDFHWYENTDFDGDDIKPWLMDYSLDDCRRACSVTAACRAFTYNKRRNVCILKTGTGTVRASVEAVSASRMPVSVVRGRITVQNGMDLPGGDLDPSGLRNLSFEQCQSVCLDNASCVGFSYVKSRRWCWTKRQVLDRRLNNDVVSGVK